VSPIFVGLGVSMRQGTQSKSALVGMAALLLTGAAGARGQSENQNPNGTSPPTYSTTVPPNSGTTKPGSTGTNPAGSNPNPTGTKPTTTTTGKRPGGGTQYGTGTTIPGRGKGGPSRGSTMSTGGHSGGGGHTGAIAGGAIGAAAVGIGIFEAIHAHAAHAANSGPELQRLGLSLHYPEDWQLNPRLNMEDDPISFNNFNSSYLRGGIIPMGGADIDIAYFPGVRSPAPQLIASELSDTNQRQIEEHTYKIGGKNGTRVFYTDVYARGFTYKNIAIYVPHEDGLYKFFLTYHEGDSHEKAFTDDFEHILKSVRFERER
jgi:hypothetical protein